MKLGVRFPVAILDDGQWAYLQTITDKITGFSNSGQPGRFTLSTDAGFELDNAFPVPLHASSPSIFPLRDGQCRLFQWTCHHSVSARINLYEPGNSRILSEKPM